jgi:hypothetical protein
VNLKRKITCWKLSDRGQERVNISRDEHLGPITKEFVIVNPSAIIR